MCMCTQPNPIEQTQSSKPNRTNPIDMPWVHEDLTTEAEVNKYFPAAHKYAGTDAGFIRFKTATNWDSYLVFNKKKGVSDEKGAAAWRLENVGGPVKMYSKSAGPGRNRPHRQQPAQQPPREHVLGCSEFRLESRQCRWSQNIITLPAYKKSHATHNIMNLV